jgi:hypothetical protein
MGSQAQSSDVIMATINHSDLRIEILPHVAEKYHGTKEPWRRHQQPTGRSNKMKRQDTKTPREFAGDAGMNLASWCLGGSKLLFQPFSPYRRKPVSMTTMDPDFRRGGEIFSLR